MKMRQMQSSVRAACHQPAALYFAAISRALAKTSPGVPAATTLPLRSITRAE